MTLSSDIEGQSLTKRFNSRRAARTGALMVAGKVHRSRLVARAVHRDAGEEGRTKLRKQLLKGAQARAERDLHLAEELFALGDHIQPKAR